MLRSSVIVFPLILALATLPASAHAGEKEDALIDRVVSAYGGPSLLSLDSLRVSDKYIGFRYGQSHDPAEVDKVDYHSVVTVDLRERRKDFRWVRGNDDGFSTQHQLFDGSTGYRIDHTERTISEDAALTFSSVDRRHLYFLDTALAILLNNARDSAQYDGDALLYNKSHSTLSFQAQGHPKMTLFVDPDTGRISKMRRPHWRVGQSFDYHYSEWARHQGVPYAKSFYVTRGGDPFYVSVSRQVDWRSNLVAAFEKPEGYGKAGAGLDFTEMQFKQLGENLYLTGQDWGFSIFYDAGEYFIASGGYAGLSERFATVKARTGLDKPLKYQIMSHHHIDHLGGTNDVLALGANFVTIAAHVESIRNMTETEIPDKRFVLIEGAGNLADGNVQILDFANGHSSHNLVSYFPESNTVFTADLFLSREADGAPNGQQGLKDFAEMLNTAGVDARQFAAAHSARVLTAADLNASIGKIVDPVCPANWDMCPN